MEEDGDFTACRFDFRIDNKNGLTPSRRKKAERRQVNYNTLFKCKVCGSLFESRPALLAHKLVHSEFKCDYCPDTFQKKSIWRLHLSKVHNIQVDGAGAKKGGSGAVSKSVRNLLPSVKEGEGESSPEPVPPLAEVKAEPSPPSAPPPLIPPPPPPGHQQLPPPPGHQQLPPPPGHQQLPPPPAEDQQLQQPQTPIASPCGIMASPVASNPNIPGFVCINVPIFITSGDGSNTTVTAIPPGAMPQGAAAIMPQGLPNMQPLPQGAVLMPQPFLPQPIPVSDASLPSPSIPVLQPPPGKAPPAEPPQKSAAPPQGHYQQAAPTAPPSNPAPEDLEPGEIRANKARGASNSKQTKASSNGASVFQVPSERRPTRSSSNAASNDAGSRRSQCRPPSTTPGMKMDKSQAKSDSKHSVDSYVIDLSCKRTSGSKSSASVSKEEQRKSSKDTPLSSFDDDKQAMQAQYKDVVEMVDSPKPNNPPPSISLVAATAARSIVSKMLQSKASKGGMQKGKGAGLSKMVEKLWQTKMKTSDSSHDDSKPQPAVHSRIKSKPSSRSASPIVIQPEPSVETFMPLPSKPTMSFSKESAMMMSSAGQGEPAMFSSNIALERNDSVELELVKGERSLYSTIDSIMNDKVGLHITEEPSQIIEMPPVSAMPHYSEFAGFMGPEMHTKKPESDFCTLKFHTCPVCKQLFSTSEAMRQHMKKDHSTRRLTNRTRAAKPKAARVRLHCPTCSFTTTSLFTLKHHRITVHPDTFGSTTAPASAQSAGKNEQGANQGKPTPPAKETRIKCRFPGCGRVFKELRHLRVHQTHHTCEKPLVCELCLYSCRHRSSMNWHMKSRHNLNKVKGHDNRTVYIDENGMVMSKAMDELDPPESPEMYVPGTPEEGMHSMEHSISGPGNIACPSEMKAMDEQPMEITPDENEDSPLDMSIRPKSATPDLVIQTDTSPNNQAEEKPANTAGQGELSVYKIEASPGPDPKFFTSVMKFNFKNTGSKAQAAAAAQESKKCVCKNCARTFDDAEAMWKHKLDEHPEDTKYLCDICSYQTASRAELQSHMLSTHGKEVGEFKDYICFICGRGYSSKNGLNHHLMRHSEEGPPGFDCPIAGCKSRLLSKSALKNHMRRVHGKAKTQAALSADLTTQDDQSLSQGGENRLLVCGYHGCDRTFRESKHLKVHRMQHTDEKPLKCELCFYSCRQRNSMNWHMKSKHGMDKHVTPDGRTIYLGSDDSGQRM